ncbi:hypothetical protein VTK26DRAFT_6430 [Humicola hyalothermophila]
MPFFANTPEARLGRSDSKNPSTTCRGVTSTGRPCRRPIAPETDVPDNSRLKPTGIRTDDPSDESLYCWQHKDQASASAKSSPGPRMSHTAILEEPRTSIDTLAERLGLAGTQSEKPQRPAQGGKPQKRPTNMTRPKPRREASCCFCFTISVEDVPPPPRPKPHPIQSQPATVSTPPRPSGKKHSTQYLSPSSPSTSPSRPGRGSRRPSAASQISAGPLMSLIPQDTDPETASKLLAELAKPISPQDEPGYIYIFWLTPESEPSTPPREAARSLLEVPTDRRSAARRPSDVLESFARLMIGDDEDEEDGDDEVVDRGRGTRSKPKNKPGNKNKKTILLKIGRATNVQRRLNEWQRQCGYNLSLIRYYPYVPSSSSSSSAPSPDELARKMPHSHKVERLVHIELAGRGLRVADRGKCEACGREHREWFEVEASRSAVADVDEVVRRWSDWDEGLLAVE